VVDEDEDEGDEDEGGTMGDAAVDDGDTNHGEPRARATAATTISRPARRILGVRRVVVRARR
jgi:hypothetical protein